MKKVKFLIEQEKKEDSLNYLKCYLNDVGLLKKNEKFLEKNVLTKQNVQDGLLCPISLEIIKKPLTTPIGHSYEEEQFIKYVKTAGLIKDPCTSKEFKDIEMCYPNYALEK